MKRYLPTLCLGIALGVAGPKVLLQPVQADDRSAQIETEEWLKPGAIFGIHTLVPKEGADPVEAQRFLRERFFPAWRDAVPGSRVFMIEAERGAKEGTVAFLWVFADKNTRNQYFPQKDVPTDLYRQHRAKLDPLYTEEGLPKYFTWEEGTATDYEVTQ